ncbi:type IV pilin [Photobacterium angustum]|uniref:type IV pilus modification PilV family protein n=1 Tax=Photobacterium angustum TaxID=661 RepID=UPI0005DD941A|nr:prepilin-type N-terminal cleavage/methylation domain-containing protein [Photobacterium angustum]KJF95032.1 type IV pilin [Photobacterium angustum]KJG06336.1 type IV pilin [Photobacterium angustum]PSV91967.1 prepilin-type N-terminal cleavage/methylation domain-containing protein [Photobacterium angustum]PSW79331.1 prepilin-type N-terminal cleavage/methylation domain-containing protein [Photobacterium angustum]
MTSNVRLVKGFSLLEVVISLAVLSVGVLGLVKMQAYMEVKSENALKTLDALYIAESQMERYYSRHSEVIVSGDIQMQKVNFLSMADSTYCIDSVAISKGYSLTCNVSDPITALSGALRTIDVTVSWADRRGISQAVSLKTALSKYSEFD